MAELDPAVIGYHVHSALDTVLNFFSMITLKCYGCEIAYPSEIHHP